MAAGKASEAKAAAAQPLKIEIVRIFDAPRDLVYQMWAKAEHLGRWSAPKGFTIPDAASDFREGGSHFVHMKSPNGSDHLEKGKYVEIVPGKRIVMTHAWLDEAGNPGPETVVTVTLEDHGSKTKMTFVQEGFDTVGARDGHAEGWNECFDLLASALTKAVPSGGEPERELVFTRLFGAPRELVFKAFTDRHHISEWWGPNGFTTTTYEMDVRPGGQWLFTMHGPDGTDYENRVRYTDVRAPEYLAYDHDGGDGGQAIHSFKAAISFEAERGKTRVTMRLICSSMEQKEFMAKFGAIEGGVQTLSRLETYLGA